MSSYTPRRALRRQLENHQDEARRLVAEIKRMAEQLDPENGDSARAQNLATAAALLAREQGAIMALKDIHDIVE